MNVSNNPHPVWLAYRNEDGEIVWNYTIAGFTYSVMQIHEHHHWRPEDGAWNADGYLDIQVAMEKAEAAARHRQQASPLI